jgi:molybdate transport system substrate-binding protein
MIRVVSAWLVVALFGALSVAHAGVATVAVAANFAAPMKVIAAQFERETSHKLRLSFGGTGQFYAQIVNGAPFDLLLAADQATPARLAQQGLGSQASTLTYAKGKLVLWSKMPGFVDQQGTVLKSGRFEKLAMADPKLAPYGRAAMAVLNKMGLVAALQGKFVQGKSIGQSYQFVASGNAPLGFVALSQVYDQGRLSVGSAWIVPSDFYQPIKQDAILLKSGKDNAAARALLAYLQTDQVKALIRSFGYED